MERPDLRLVPDSDGPAPLCATCGEGATMSSAVDRQPLCLGCFQSIHWHPSWSGSHEAP